ncbi:hypothetical protein ACH42_13600 [Endozoicomonas sp. (ex Bugula neritina AB1)]|nr:hypothetical protein ACH42_13600 [Endozoicomonas sp. (ex Bugula neritina AB1)]
MQKVRASIALSVTLLLTGCSEPVEQASALPVRPVKLYEIKDTQVQSLRQFPAKVRASEEASLSFRIPGELEALLIQPAQHVKKGDVLARLDDRDIRSELLARQAEFDLASVDFARVEQLRAKKIVSQSDYDNISAKLKSTQAALQLTKDKLKDSVLIAPFSGRVAQTKVENYQSVQAQQPILDLQGDSVLEISIQVPESIVSQVRSNNIDYAYQPVVRFYGSPDKQYFVQYKEHATNVTPGTQSYEVSFSLSAPEDMTIYPGMGATLFLDLLRITKQDVSATIITPLSTVLRDDASGKTYAWKYDTDLGTVSPVEVTLGPIGQSGVTIKSGLAVGDHIIAAGLNRLKAGMQVKPLLRERGL